MAFPYFKLKVFSVNSLLHKNNYLTLKGLNDFFFKNLTFPNEFLVRQYGNIDNFKNLYSHILDNVLHTYIRTHTEHKIFTHVIHEILVRFFYF